MLENWFPRLDREVSEPYLFVLKDENVEFVRNCLQTHSIQRKTEI